MLMLRPSKILVCKFRPPKIIKSSMIEYTQVEQPFLHQLAELGWEVIDQGSAVALLLKA